MVNNDNALIERLRFEQVIRKYDDGRTLTQKLNPDGNDAANRIEALSAENERLREALLQMKRIPNYIRKDDNRKEMLKIINAALGETK